MGKEDDYLRILVVDDERPCLDELVYMLSKQENVKIAGAFTDPLEALEVSAKLMPDAAFLDLSMPHLNGAELARIILIHSPGTKIVFVTAYRKELERLSYDAAFASILKPVSEMKLHKIMQRIHNDNELKEK